MTECATELRLLHTLRNQNTRRTEAEEAPAQRERAASERGDQDKRHEKQPRAERRQPERSGLLIGSERLFLGLAVMASMGAVVVAMVVMTVVCLTVVCLTVGRVPAIGVTHGAGGYGPGSASSRASPRPGPPPQRPRANPRQGRVALRAGLTAQCRSVICLGGPANSSFHALRSDRGRLSRQLPPSSPELTGL